MSSIEVYQLVLDTLIAIGTVGAVVISLGILLHRKQKFTISDFKIFDHRNEDRTHTRCLGITVHNHLQFEMEVQKAEAIFYHDKGNHRNEQSWTLKDVYIAPVSRREVNIPLRKGWLPNRLQEAEKVNFQIHTSFGVKMMPFPKNKIKALCDALEVSPEAKEAA